MDPFNQPIDVFTHKAALKEMKSTVNDYVKEQVIAVFSTPEGLRLLDTLEDLYVRQPVCPVNSPTGYGHFREGQNSLILKFRQWVSVAQQQNFRKE